MKKISILLLFIISFNLLFSQNEITANEIQQHINFLASDSLKGRFPGTKESDIAAKYILDNFKSDGLQPLCDNGFQYFKIWIRDSLYNSTLKFGNNKIKSSDYVVINFTKSGEFLGKAVFVGYGINAKDSIWEWNDYKNANVKGKWVIVLRGKPEVQEYPANFFDYVSSEYSKVLEATDNGAIGVIFINSPANEPSDKLYKICKNSRNRVQTNIAVINVNRKTADLILKSTGKNTQQLEQSVLLDADFKPIEINENIYANIDNRPVEVQTENVVAMLPGNDSKLKNQYIVVGAHFDHLGLGGCQSGSRIPDTIAIHNGADDNASGVAGVLEMAEYFSKSGIKLSRSVIFICFSAEERGLLGSDYFVKNLPIPHDSIAAMINFDMIGKSIGKLNIMSVGSAKEFADIITKIQADTSVLKVVATKSGNSGSDHASFLKARIPALFFYASNAVGYHTPFDDADKINSDVEANVLNYAAKIIEQAADYPSKFTFQETSEKSGSHGYGMKVRLGIIPSYEESENTGLEIEGIVEKGPAEKSGMQKNDIIIAINGLNVGNINDYMARMQKINPGEKAIFLILRNGIEMEIVVQF